MVLSAGFWYVPLVAFDRDGEGRLAGFLLLGSHLERFHVGVLRIGDGIEIDRSAVSLRRARVRLGPQRGQPGRQVFGAGSLLDNKRAAGIALAPGDAGIDRGQDADGVVGRQHRFRHGGCQQTC
jgi:hypothetical protein